MEQKLGEILKELQDIRSILESNQESVDIQKADFIKRINDGFKKTENKVLATKPLSKVTFQEVLKASRQYLQEY